MTGNSEVNKNKIAANTIILYIRMMITLLISLYTSRVILRTLGVVDFGVYNVVGGVVTLFTVFSGPLYDSTMRFLTFELGRKNVYRLKQVFSSSLVLHIILGVIIFVLTESIGIWLVKCVLQIPTERINAAIYVLHFSALTIMLSVFCVPYRADVIAHEKMNVFAVISILEVVLRLIIVIALSHIGLDRLISYAFLLMILQVVVFSLYLFYCSRNFIESRTVKHANKGVLHELASFVGWSMTGGVTGVCNNQGINIVLNIFWGPIVNSARGIAVQVQSALSLFCKNIQEAINPQITKTYAAHDLDNMHNLLIASSKYSFLMMLLFAMPIYFQTEFVLEVWLGEYPPHTLEFVRCTVILSMIEILANPLIVSNHATGNIKKFQIIVESISILPLPLSLLVLNIFEFPPEIVYYLLIVVALMAQTARMVLVLPRINMPYYIYIKIVLIPITLVTIFTFSTGMVVKVFFKPMGVAGFFMHSAIIVMVHVICSFYLAISIREREVLKELIRRAFCKHMSFNKK